MKYNRIVDKSDLQDNLLWQLLLVSFRGKKGLIQIADEYGLTFVQVYTLCSILPDKPLSMNEIANMLNCDASNVTGIIDRLFAQEYIIRQEKPGDRRVKIISLTTKGEKLRKEIVGKILNYKSDSLEKLSATEKAQLKTLLRKILE